MGLNIKNPKLEAEIRELAALTGETLTEAIAAAVRERRQKLGVKPSGRREALAAIQESISLPEELRTSRHDDLYDEHGLPV